MSRKKLDAANLILDPSELPAGAPTVDASRRRVFVRGGRLKMADRKERQLLVYMSTPDLRREVDIRAAQEGVTLSAFVERLVKAELAKPLRRVG